MSRRVGRQKRPQTITAADQVSAAAWAAWLVVAHLAVWPVDGVQAGDYETPGVRRASDVLAPALIHGPHYRIDEMVELVGFRHVFSVESDYGTFRVNGDAMLRRLMREITALVDLRERHTLAVTGEASIKELLDPLNALKRLAVEPVDTVVGIPLGTKRLIESAVSGLTRERGPYEDTDLKALLTVASNKRRIAFSYGVDPYSSNEVLQRELDRVAWAYTAGYGTTFLLILAPVPNPLPLAMASLTTVELLNDALERKGPEELFQLNRRQLKDMGIPDSLAGKFLVHRAYSPRHRTVITFSLKALDGVLGREQFVRAALETATEEDALWFQQLAEMLRRYHQNTGRLQALTTVESLPVGLAESGTVFLGIPADHLPWTERVEQVVARLKQQPRGDRQVRRYEVWLTGTLSARARQELLARGIAPRELVGSGLDLLD